MRNRTYGGVRGRKTKVGRKLLRFPPTRFVGSICCRGQNQFDKFIPISVDIEEELQISLFFILTFVVSN